MEKYRLIADTSKVDYELPQSSFESGHAQHHHAQQQPQHRHQQQQQRHQPSRYPTETEYPEVRITQQGKPRNYISYAMNLFSDGSLTISLKAMGRAINKAVTIAEILKRKMPLHQWNTLSSVEMIDVYEPVEEGLDTVESRRYVSCMTITLSITLLADPSMDTNHTGYQPPLPLSELHPRDFHHSSQQRQMVIPTK